MFASTEPQFRMSKSQMSFLKDCHLRDFIEVP
jgi:hypothetical protein